jgi:hypothetical protein
MLSIGLVKGLCFESQALRPNIESRKGALSKWLLTKPLCLPNLDLLNLCDSHTFYFSAKFNF